MEFFITSFILFIIVYLIYFVLVIKNKKMLKKYRHSKEVLYLENKYLIPIDKIPLKKLANDLSISNSLIIIITFIISELINNLYLKLMAMFLSLFVLILIFYHILGKIYQKKYGILDTKKGKRNDK